MMSNQLSQLKAQFDLMTIAEKEQCINNLKMQAQGPLKNNPGFLRILDECIHKYDAEVYANSRLNVSYNPVRTNTLGHKLKSKMVSGLLAILLGNGIYNFYLGYIGKAVVQLSITLLAYTIYLFDIIAFVIALSQWSGFGTGPEIFSSAYIIGSIILIGVGIWQFIEGILIFIGVIARDGKGNPIT
jgi:hypothetical protein